MPKYRWSSANEWLDEKIDSARNAELTSIAKQLASLVDGDQIQDIFQAEMEADGFFTEETD